jgi:hypothetical protein
MDLVRMARSLSAGGVPGSAEGMPAIPSGLERMLPPNLARIGTEMMPGGTAA